MQIVELLGIIGGFYEVLWFGGLFLMSYYIEMVKEYDAVEQVYGKAYLKERIGFNSYTHYLCKTITYYLIQIFGLCGFF